MKTALIALAVGTAVTLVLFGLGFVAAEAGLVTLSYVLYWQGWMLSVLAACPYEGRCVLGLIHLVAFYGGIPVGIIVYAGLFHLLRQLFGRAEKGSAP